MSIGSIALTVNAVHDQNEGIANSPGLEVITFSPDKKQSLLRKNSILFIDCPTNVGIGLVALSPTILSV